MPRRREVPKRKITPDPKYRDRMVAKFTNVVMLEGVLKTRPNDASALQALASYLRDAGQGERAAEAQRKLDTLLGE